MHLFRCSSRTTVLEENIHCPDCDKYYNICALEHVCNRELPCTRRGDPPKIINLTIYAVPTDIEYDQRRCAECTEKIKLANAPTYNECHGCGYKGWYKPDAITGKCPSCTAAPAEPEERRDIAEPTEQPAPGPRKRQPAGVVLADRNVDGSVLRINVLVYEDTADLCSKAVENYVLPIGDSTVSEFIKIKKSIELSYPQLIWVDVPRFIVLYLENTAADLGIGPVF